MRKATVPVQNKAGQARLRSSGQARLLKGSLRHQGYGGQAGGQAPLEHSGKKNKRFSFRAHHRERQLQDDTMPQRSVVSDKRALTGQAGLTQPYNFDSRSATDPTNRNSQAGLTLLELIIYIATASIVTLGIITLFTLLANSWVRVQARARVEEGARLAVERMRFEIEEAQAILSPAPSDTGNTLSVHADSAPRPYSGDAWSEHLGWISFDCTDGGPTWDDCDQSSVDINAKPREVTSSYNRLSGWAATENTGLILMNCAESSGASTCTTADYAVTVDASGDYHGWAWGEGVGWISFNCENTGSCLGSGSLNPCGGVAGNWRVCEVWDTTDREYKLRGWAWSELAGWISFNCENHDSVALCSNMTAGAGDSADYEVTANISTGGSELTFGVDAMTSQLYMIEGVGVRQYLTDDDIFVDNCTGWGTDYFRVVANPFPARAAVSLCFTATYQGAGQALTNYSTEVQTSFQLR